MDFLGLLGGSGLSGTDGPYGLVGDDDVLHVLGGEVCENVDGLGFDHFEVLAGFALLEALAHAEDYAEAVVECEPGLVYELGVGLAVVLTALGVSEDGVLGTGGSHHSGGNLSGVGALLLVCAVLCGKAYGSALDDLCHRYEVGCRGGDDEFHGCRDFTCLCNDCLCELYALRNCSVHLPVACYDVLSHMILFMVSFFGLQI